MECVYNGEDEENRSSGILSGGEGSLLEWTVLISPFFFWGTAMVAMKEVLPITGPFFVAAFRLIPAGLLLVAFAVYKGRPLPKGINAWLSIALFALVDATCFQVCLLELNFLRIKLIDSCLNDDVDDDGSGFSCSRVTENFCWFRKCKLFSIS